MSRPPAISFLPVPVAISGPVRRAFGAPPVSHRSREFRRTMDEAHALLLGLTGAAHVEMFLGSGTLANEVVAAQLSLLDGPGLVLTNGEFGDRLVDQATRWGLRFSTFAAEWGTPFDYAALERVVADGEVRWVWGVHCETFLGTLNSRERLEEICRDHGVKLCLDCISSVGAVPVRLDGVYLATAVSGKGIAAYPGIAMVFSNHEAVPDMRLPRYLDLGYCRAKGGVPFTHSSNLVAALRAALGVIAEKPKCARIRRESDWLRRELERAGIRIVSGGGDRSPAILTCAVPRPVSSVHLGEALEESGFLLTYRSDYLAKNNLLRICLLGATTHGDHRRLLEALVGHYRRLAASTKDDDNDT